MIVLQDVLDSKNSAIKDLQYELARVCKVGSRLFTSSPRATNIAKSGSSSVAFRLSLCCDVLRLIRTLEPNLLRSLRFVTRHKCEALVRQI